MNLITIKELSVKANCSVQYIHKLIKDNKLPSSQMGYFKVVDADNADIQEFISIPRTR